MKTPGLTPAQSKALDHAQKTGMVFAGFNFTIRGSKFLVSPSTVLALIRRGLLTEKRDLTYGLTGVLRGFHED